MAPASVLLRCLWHLAKPGSGPAAGEETKAAAGEMFNSKLSECGGLPVQADGGALRALPPPLAGNGFSDDIFSLLTTK